jgi:hypothetical protein
MTALQTAAAAMGRLGLAAAIVGPAIAGITSRPAPRSDKPG